MNVKVSHPKSGLFLIFLYLILEYAKPVWLANIRPMLVVEAAMLVYIFLNVRLLSELIKDKFYVLYLLLLLEMTIHGPTAANNYYALEGWLLMATYLIFMITISLTLSDEEYVIVFINMLLFVHLVISVDHFITGKSYFGSSGVLNDTNDLAAGMVFVTPISFLVGYSCRGWKRYVYWCAATLFVFVTVSSMSRGGFIGMSFVVLYSLLKVKSKLKSALALVFVAIVAIISVPDDYKKEILSIKAEGYEAGTGRDRIELWKIAWGTFIDNPIIGVGQGNLPWVWGAYQDPDDSLLSRGVGGRAVHSIYFTVLPELGIVGSILFILMLYELYRKYRKWTRVEANKENSGSENQRKLTHILTGSSIGLIGYLICGIFLSTFYYPQIWNIASVFVAYGYLQTKCNSSLIHHAIGT